jgi:uncharacterized protein DUF3311
VAVHEPPDRPPSRSTTDATARAARSDRSPWNWLLLVPLLITLYPPLYNHEKPKLFDIPFFYWFQLAAIVVSVAMTLLVFRKTRD